MSKKSEEAIVFSEKVDVNYIRIEYKVFFLLFCARISRRLILPNTSAYWSTLQDPALSGGEDCKEREGKEDKEEGEN